TRNLLRIAIFNISYIRGLFPEKYFNDKSVPALEMKIKKLMPLDAESRRLIDWMEKGVYDALQKRYLKTLLFCVCEAVDGPMIEEYAFSFCYSDSDNQEVSMNINRTGNKKKGTFKYNSTTEITPQQMRSSACKMIRTLVQLMRTLEKMPEERTILMKLLYYDDVTPADYEPPFFRGCTEEEAYHPWSKNPLKMEVGNVNSKHFVLALKVKSVLDPCEDDNEEMQDDMNTCNDSMQQDEYDDTDSEKSEYEFTIVKEEVDGQAPQVFDKPLQSEDLIYMKALYQALPMTYVSVSKLQSLLEGEVNLTAARRIIDKMTRDGFLEPKGNKRLGKRVIHSELSERKFIEVQKALNAMEAMDVDHCEPNSKPKQSDFRLNVLNILHLTDMVCCGNVQPVDSRESFAQGQENSTENVKRTPNQKDEADINIFSYSSQDKRPRKTSAVKEPIHQNVKRQRAQTPRL
ncbi:hypothetical protein TanjilG_20120, partial [Lupinus angustifolius]